MGWFGLGWQGRHDSGAGPYSYACCSDNNDKGKVCQTAPLVGMPHLQLLHPTRPQDICYGCVRAKDSGNYRVWGCFFGGFHVDGVGFDLELRIGFGLFMHKFSAKKGACQISVYTFICFAVGWSREKNAELRVS